MTATKKRRKNTVRVNMSYAQCTVLSNVPTVCPMCAIVTTPRVVHRCGFTDAKPASVLPVVPPNRVIREGDPC